MPDSTAPAAADATEQLRLIERLTLGGPPKRFAAQIGWTVFGSCLGAYLGVTLANAPEWSRLVTLVVLPSAAVGLALLLGFLARKWAIWVVNMAWDDWHSDPCGTVPACPGCGEVWASNTRCCGNPAYGPPTVHDDGSRACSACGAADPVSECCDQPWVRRCDTYVQGHGIMTERNRRMRPAMWPQWRPGVRDFVRSVFRGGRSSTAAPRGASTDPARDIPTLAAVGELSGSVPLGRKSTAPGLCCRGPWRVRSAPCVGLSAIIHALSHHKVDSPPPNRAVSREEGTRARLHEAVSAAPPPTMAACAGQDVPATRYAPTEGLVASPFQGRPVDAGSLARVVVAPDQARGGF